MEVLPQASAKKKTERVSNFALSFAVSNFALSFAFFKRYHGSEGVNTLG